MIRQRCAVYTRKSTEEGLDQNFNSLDAQREACAAYILSQRHEGWTELADRYDDGGYSGGSMERPGLVRLLEDVRAGRIDVIVVYKVDRLTRALSDFAKMVEVFDAAGVSFVSVTQAFNTTSSMGRLTLNVLLSFAQFEREVTAERIRDKVTASKRKGMWMGGAVSMGYDAVDKALVVNPAEAEAIRTIFREYVRLGSVPDLIRRLDELGIVSRQRTNRFGRTTGGTAYSRGALYHLLRNPLYIGKVRHGDDLHDGLHEPLVDQATWAAAQQGLDANGGGPIAGQRRAAERWLDGVLIDAKGRTMKTKYASKKVPGAGATRRYHYYVSRIAAGDDDRKQVRLPAQETEAAVRTAVTVLLNDRERMLEACADADAEHIVPAKLLAAAEAYLPAIADAVPSEAERSLAGLVQRVDVLDDRLRITLRIGALIQTTDAAAEAILRFETTLDMNQNGRARPIVVRTGQHEPRRDPELIALVADARRWMRDLLEGRASSADEITRAEKLRKGAVSRILPLAWLAPDIAAAILEGRQPATLSANRLRDLPELPLDWSAQRRLLGFAAA